MSIVSHANECFSGRLPGFQEEIMSIDDREAENRGGAIEGSGIRSEGSKGEGESAASGEPLELTELEAEQVSGGLLSVNDKCINAIKC